MASGKTDNLVSRRDAAGVEGADLLQGALRFAPLLLVVLDAAGRIQSAQGSALDRLGIDAGGLTGKPAQALYGAPAEPEIGVQRALAGEAFTTLHTIGQRWYESHFEPLLDAHGTQIGALVVSHDVTRRTEAENGLMRAAEARTRRQAALADLGRGALAGSELAELMAMAVEVAANELEVDFADVVEMLPFDGCSARIAARSGWRQEQVGATVRLPEHSPLLTAELRDGGPITVFDWPNDPRFRWPAVLREPGIVRTVWMPIRTHSGGAVALFGVLGVHSRSIRHFSADEIGFLDSLAVVLAHAITRKRTEQDFRALVEHAPDIIARFDRDLRCLYINPVVERLTGIPAERIQGSTARDMGLPEPYGSAWELVMRQAFHTGQEQTFEYTQNTLRGERSYQCRIVPERGPNDTYQSVLMISRDVTAERRSETELSGLYREVLERQQHMQEMMSRMLLERERDLGKVAAQVQAEKLTERERQVLRLVAVGWSNPEIGAELGATAGTIKNHMSHILKKLDVSDRTQAAVKAFDLGLIDPQTYSGRTIVSDGIGEDMPDGIHA